MKTQLRSFAVIFFFVFTASALFSQFDPYFHLIWPEIEKPKTIFSADFDGDNDLDLLIGAGNMLAWYSNEDGQGTFGAPIAISLKAKPVCVKAADLDGDGDLDALFASSNKKIAWHENLDGQGQFGQEHIIEGFTFLAYDVNFADIDGDGDADVISTSAWPYQISWFENLDGQGNFSDKKVIYESSNPIRSAFAGDMDGDGDFDVVCARPGNGGDCIFWFRNEDGQGTFSALIAVFNNAEAGIVVGADLDDDGDLDILGTGITSNDYPFWHENTDGAGTFGPVQTIVTSIGTPQTIDAGDLDGDGDLDILLGATSTSKLVWFENLTGEGDFGPPIPVYAITSFPETAITADINGDNNVDVVAGFEESNEVAWYKNLDGAGNFDQPNFILNISTDFFELAATGDLDGDGDQDVLTGYNLPNREFCWFKNENGNFGDPHVFYNLGNWPIALTTCDIDADGDQDILVSTNSSDKTEWLENLDGLGNFGPPQLILNWELKKLILSDLDGDGDPDLIVPTHWYRNENGGENFVQVMELPIPVPSEYGSAKDAEDIDGDGDQDIVIEYTEFVGVQEHRIAWLENMDGQGTFENETLVSVFPTQNISFLGDIVLTDLDGDADIDIVFGDSEIYWAENFDGAGHFSEAKLVGGVTFTFKLGAADLDSDGDMDIYAGGSTTEIFTWFENLGNALSFHKGNISGAGKDLAPADLDGDGDLDMVVAVSSSLRWYENQSLSEAKAEGIVFWDQNENGIQDGPAEIGLHDQKVHLQPLGTTTFSLEGAYIFYAPDGSYQVVCEPSGPWEFTTDSLYPIAIQYPNSITSPAFGLKATADIWDGAIDLSSGPTGCNQEYPFWVTWKNKGTLEGSGSISLTLDTLTSFVVAFPAPDSVNGNTLFWDFHDLPPTYSDLILLYLQMPSEDYVGEFIHLTAGLRLEDSQGNLQFSTEDQYQSQVNCAVDPNDKLVEPNIPGNDNYTLFGDTLQYTIRFQNTGTDTAQTVRIVDHLDPNLDWSSFRVVAFSHPCVAFLDANGKATFLFENIMLPDSAANALASNGFVKFEILPVDSLLENTEIMNAASIFFDFNAPVITNTVINILVSGYPLVIEVQNPVCGDVADGSIQALAIAPEAVWYYWDNGQTGPMLTGVAQGEYTLTVENGDGKIVADTTILIIAPPPLNLTAVATPTDQGLSNGTATASVAGGTPPYTYEWNTNPPQYTETIADLDIGAYQVIVTDSNGCIAITEVIVEETVGVDVLAKPIYFRVSPNPSTGAVLIEFELSGTKPWTLHIHTANGQIWKEFQAPNSGSKAVSLSVGQLPPGVFIASLLIDNQEIAKEIILIQR